MLVVKLLHPKKREQSLDSNATKYRALVCGASKGIGRAIAIELASRGYSVYALARSKEKLETLRQYGINPIVSDLDQREKLQVDIVPYLPFHILINNSAGPQSGALLDADLSELQNAFSRHVLSSHMLVQMVLKGMKSVEYGRIVNIISTSVYEPIPNLGVSNTIRAAMAGWAKTLSRELPAKITINNILPGFTDTDRLAMLRQKRAEKQGVSESEVLDNWLHQVPEARLADPKEIAKAVGFLVSEDASYIRGVSLAVDGGRLRSI